MAAYADIKGLPLILGGEIRAISKLAGRAESAVILVRGPAGSGKSIFAAQLAAHEALVRDGDVVYACVELLPSELDAQLSGLAFGPERRALRVSNLPASAPTASLAPRVFASIIDVPEFPEPDIGAELQRIIGDATRAGLAPRVVVIDSLTDGYRLGALLPRYLADALCKFAAEQGILLVLIEEVIDQRDSIWTFVADVVLELAHHGASGTPASEDRALTVRKNRFGPAQVGPHPFAILRSGGIEIYPRISAYASEAARTLLPHDVPAKVRRPWKLTTDHDGPWDLPQGNEVVLITGQHATIVALAVQRLVSGSQQLYLDMTRTTTSDQRMLPCGDPMLSPERLLSMFCAKLKELSKRIDTLVIGDLDAIKHHLDPDGLRRSLAVLIMLAQDAGLPIALFETAPQHHPWSSHLAGTVIRVRLTHTPQGDPELTGVLSSLRRGTLDTDVTIAG